MKNVIIIILLFASCENAKKNLYEIDSYAEIVKVRNCEYIKSHVYGGDVYIHCADCKNPQHK